MENVPGTAWWKAAGAAAVAAALLLPAGLAAPAQAAAQMRLIGQVGLYVPLSDLGQVQSGGDAVEIADREGTLGFGLALELGARQTWSFRVNGVYGTESGVPVSGVGCTDCKARSTVAALTGTAVFRPLPNLIVVQPYLQAGGGLKRYDFDDDDLRAEGFDAFLSDQNKLAGHLGVGAEVNAGLVRLLFEVSDFISGIDLGGDDAVAEEETQHDFLITIGVSIGG